MGRNFMSACHCCQQRVFHQRGFESVTLHAFYKKHEQCMRQSPRTVETLDDQLQERSWMRDDSYQSDTEIEKLGEDAIDNYQTSSPRYINQGDRKKIETNSNNRLVPSNKILPAIPEECVPRRFEGLD